MKIKFHATNISLDILSNTDQPLFNFSAEVIDYSVDVGQFLQELPGLAQAMQEANERFEQVSP